MAKYLDIFQIDAPIVSMNNVSSWESVIPEISTWPGWLDDDHALITEGRIVVRQLVNSSDGYRGAWMHTVCFDHQPVLIIQRAGRDGRDHFKRWIVDSGVYLQLMSYVQSKLFDVDELNDVVNLYDNVYPETLWHFYGSFHGSTYGVETAPKTVDGEIIHNVMIDYFPTSSSDDFLILLKPEHPLPPQRVRRGDCVLEFLAIQPADERAKELGYDRISCYRVIELFDPSIPCI